MIQHIMIVVSMRTHMRKTLKKGKTSQMSLENNKYAFVYFLIKTPVGKNRRYDIYLE
jgi:hypothetical protein